MLPGTILDSLAFALAPFSMQRSAVFRVLDGVSGPMHSVGKECRAGWRWRYGVHGALGPFAIAFLTYSLRTLLSAMRASARRCHSRSHELTTTLVSLLNVSPRRTPLDTSPRLSFHLNRVARRCPTFLPRLRSKSFPVSSSPCPSILALTREGSEEISGSGKALPKLGFGAGHDYRAALLPTLAQLITRAEQRGIGYNSADVPTAFSWLDLPVFSFSGHTLPPLPIFAASS
ncbi:hypothetical protein B0H13DRAFT_2359835 [Mycena leptocephala]|nr:hypothetical protein B0H13DRAFT_2359835 [Mycena leptocephala]